MKETLIFWIFALFSTFPLTTSSSIFRRTSNWRNELGIELIPSVLIIGETLAGNTCVGAFLNAEAVITTAKCISSILKESDSIFVDFNEELLPIKKINIHPFYNKKEITEHEMFDAAILILNNTINEREEIIYVAVDNSGSLPQKNEFYVTENSEKPSLSFESSKQSDLSKCVATTAHKDIQYDSKVNICVEIRKNRKNRCSTREGMVFSVNETIKRFVLHGFLSNDLCVEDSKEYLVFIKIALLRDWIWLNIEKPVYCKGDLCNTEQSFIQENEKRNPLVNYLLQMFLETFSVFFLVALFFCCQVIALSVLFSDLYLKSKKEKEFEEYFEVLEEEDEFEDFDYVINDSDDQGFNILLEEV